MDFRPIAGVVWYAVGRFYEAADGTLEDAGYFLHLGGVEGPLFTGMPGEATACFTFRSEPFRLEGSVKNGDLSVSLDATGGFSLYFNAEPCGDWSRPESFSRGKRIATFERLFTAVGTAVGPVGSNLFTAALRTSEDFHFGGRTWNLGRYMPRGITQMGLGSTTPLPGIPGYSKVTAFVGSAMALGGNVQAP